MSQQDQGADATQGRWLVIPRTLCFVFHGDRVLLMKRAPHRRIFPNYFNGLGGHLERNEDPASCALREIREESGADVTDLRLRGVYNIDTAQNNGIVLYIFTAQAHTDTLNYSHDEGTLYWVPINEIHQLKLVEDLEIILPKILEMNECTIPFSAHLSYDTNDQLVMRFFQEE